MDKENNRSAAGLRRSAIAERIRLREEWSALKGTSNDVRKLQKQTNKKKVLSQRQKMADKVNARKLDTRTNTVSKNKQQESDEDTSSVLAGVVALVEVGSESRALALRAALTALGATVVPKWNPLVTHLVWAEGGSRSVRARARALACWLVSPLWVAASAAERRALNPRAFPAAARRSDLPSPATLRALLKRAEAVNIPLVDLLSDSKDESDKMPRLRISSDTSHDQSMDKSTDKSIDKSTDTSADIQSRVNTAPRRLLPLSPQHGRKSRRKLFTHRTDGADVTDDENSDTDRRPKSKPIRLDPVMLSQQRRDLAIAEKIARKIAGKTGGEPLVDKKPGFRIVLTGMSSSTRCLIHKQVQSLGGRIQKQVNKYTTHVVMGNCGQDSDVTGVTNLISPRPYRRTLTALCGAARGCLVLTQQWILHCGDNTRWMHHHGYEVKHLQKISQKARVERSALGKKRSEYAYDVFSGMRVRITSTTEQKYAAITLLNLCGAVTVIGDRQDGRADSDIDVTLGAKNGEVCSKWVFDSVAAGRMRTTRRYVVNSNSQLVSLTQTGF